MIKRMALVKAMPGISRAAFQEYYENVHVPLSLKMYPMIAEYRRNFIERDTARLAPGASEVPFDVIVEHRFASEADHQAFLQRRALPEVKADLRADGLNFLDLSQVFAFLVKETGGRVDFMR